jgi:predicted NAD-dependent protein-ADP-ribosyltransferase YbiA (DUF1768 family)
MVSSRLNPNINYQERRQIEEDDLGFSSSIYELDVYDITIAVVIGRPKLTYVNKNIIYFPIYIISADDKIKSQIGIFEISASAKDITKYTNTELELDEDKLGEPVLYSFATKRYLQKANSQLAFEAAAAADAPEPAAAAAVPVPEPEPEEDIPEEDVFRLDVKKIEEAELDTDTDGAYKIRNMDAIFTKARDVRPLAELSEETEEDNKQYKKEYNETSKTEWVEKFFKNNYYKIDENDGVGDCFFLVVRDAFATMGYITTVEKLRKIVADAATDDIFEMYRTMYQNVKNEITETDKTIKQYLKINVELKKQSETGKNKDESEILIKRAKENLAEIERAKVEKKNALENLDEFAFMDGVDTLEKFKHVIMSQRYWANEWAIKELEKRLHIKIVILSKEAFHQGSLDTVLKCGEQIDEEVFKPYFYIMTSYSGTHYELVTYKAKKILIYKEIPYTIKVLVLNKCMEKNAGSYTKIPEFKQLKEHYGIPTDDAVSVSVAAAAAAAEDLYDGDVEFMFYSQSADAKVGKGTGEKIPPQRIQEFSKINAEKHWRRKLDDDYYNEEDGVFELNGKRWGAVEIYYQAAKFRKQNTEFYNTFSLDSGSEISKSVELAKIAGSISGKGKIKIKDEMKAVVLRDKSKIKVDSDFYNGVRNKEERKAAILAKFEQNAPFRNILLLTKRALLKQFKRRAEPEADVELMEVREYLENHKQKS